MQNDTLKPLLTAWQTGDSAAFDAIYRDLSVPVYTLVCRIVRNRAQAEDITQEVFVKLLTAGPPSEQLQNPRAWLFQIARNAAIDAVRKHTADPLPDDIEAHPVRLDDMVGTRVDIESALTTLSHDDRAIVTLHLNAGLPFRLISQMIDMPLGTVLWRYQKALDALRQELQGGISQ